MTDLSDLAVFFECDPRVRPSDVPWEYSDATFVFDTKEDTVHCRLAPSEGQISLVWQQRGLKLVEVSLEGYFDVKLERLAGRDRLVALSNRDDLSPLVVRLRPRVFIGLGSVAQRS